MNGTAPARTTSAEATEPTIRPHDELTIAPAPIIPRDAIAFDLDESERRGRFIAVYNVTPSKGGKPYQTVYHARSREWYCTCLAGKNGNLCKHIKSVAYYNAYNAAYRAYVTCTMDELREHDRDFVRIERGHLASYRGWEIDRDAMADLIAERLKQAA